MDWFFSSIEHWWRLWRTPRTAVRDLATGRLAKVVGRALPEGEPILGPFTGRRLAALSTKGVRLEGRGRHTVVHTLEEVEKGHSFFLEDETGLLRVDRAGFSRLMVVQRRVTGGREAEEHIERYFARYGQHERTFFEGFGHRTTYYECGIEVGAEIAVLGLVSECDAPPPNAPGHHRDSARLLRIEPPPHGPLLVSDVTWHRER